VRVTRVFAALGPCLSCGVLFFFYPDTVPSVPIDPVTGLPPDLGGDPQRATRRPVCVSCRRRANPARIAAGLRPWPIPEDDA